MEGDVLIVDDNFLMRETLQEYLGSKGIVAQTCDNGIDALERVSMGSYRVLLIDYRMPRMNGEELVRAIRKFDQEVFIIGYSFEFKDRQFLDAGADAFLLKENLTDRIVTMIRERALSTVT